MCGIIGIAVPEDNNLSGEGYNQTQLKSAMQKMAYRGPDASSTWTSADETVILGHLRLSIHDLSEHGTQPMLRHVPNRGDFVIAFNGEVYNFIELRAELSTLGYSFTTGTDTEVALFAFVAWGKKCFERFNGMFAIAIWSQEDDTITLARDLSGEKPLYYHLQGNGCLLFSSELKSLNALAGIKDTSTKDLDPVLVGAYMDYGYVPGRLQLGAPDTLKGVAMDLAPGHVWVWHARHAYISKTFASEPYMALKRTHECEDDYQTATTKVRRIFKRACELRLRADVPVGVFLSGGLDSSVVVAQMSEIGTHKIKTFSVRYDMDTFGLGFDESQYARQISKQFNTEHHEFTMTPQLFVDYLDKYIEVMDTPVTEAAAISLHYVSELAKPHVTVVLSGEGSDEIFAGYEIYRTMKLIDLARMIVTPVGAAILSKLGQLICPSTHKIQKYLRWLSQPLEARYRGVSSSDPKDKHRLLRKEFLNKIKNQEPQHSLTQWISEIFEANKTWPTLERLMDFDRKTFLANDLLIKADRMSMYSSLELRVPFLDPILMQYVINLPSHYKIHKGDPKRILKDAYPELPDNIRFREKTGFPTPLAQMFKSGPLLERTVAEFTADHPVFTILDFEACSLLLQNHINGKEDNHAALWRILVLALWVKKNCNVQQ